MIRLWMTPTQIVVGLSATSLRRSFFAWNTLEQRELDFFDFQIPKNMQIFSPALSLRWATSRWTSFAWSSATFSAKSCWKASILSLAFAFQTAKTRASTFTNFHSCLKIWVRSKFDEQVLTVAEDDFDKFIKQLKWHVEFRINGILGLALVFITVITC